MGSESWWVALPQGLKEERARRKSSAHKAAGEGANGYKWRGGRNEEGGAEEKESPIRRGVRGGCHCVPFVPKKRKYIPSRRYHSLLSKVFSSSHEKTVFHCFYLALFCRRLACCLAAPSASHLNNFDVPLTPSPFLQSLDRMVACC